MIDIHTHLLPGVDDGSKSYEQSLDVLVRFVSAGVTCIVCTPHLVASEADRVPQDRYRRTHRELCGIAPAAITIQRGWEIMLDRPGIDLSAPFLRLGASNALLVEFPRGVLPPGTEDELSRLRQSGVLPVVAHPERYGGMTIELVRAWRAAGAVIQTDTAYLLGNGAKAVLARDMLAEGLIDILASDNHGDLRSLSAAQEWLTESGAPDASHLLTTVNPEALLSDQRLVPVPRVVLEKGMMSRLRDLVGLRKSAVERTTPIV